MVTGFAWILRGRLAGSGQPGLLGSITDDMEFLRDQGFSLIVTLTEQPLAMPAERFGMRSLHFPVPDMGFPMPRAVAPLCRDILDELQRDQPVLVHCRAGLGRTGTILGCCLVQQGSSPEQALAEMRSINGNYVQTRAQEQLICHYHAFITKN